MESLLRPVSLPTSVNSLLPYPPQSPASLPSRRRFLYFSAARPPTVRCHRLRLSPSDNGGPGEDDPETLVQDLRVPDAWLLPSNALQESEWLRLTLHKWLDDEYCPEPANVEISKVAARSYYESLMAKQTDLGEILLKMVGDLETVSFQESFHGVFSSANAAVHLITLKMNSTNVR